MWAAEYPDRGEGQRAGARSLPAQDGRNGEPQGLGQNQQPRTQEICPAGDPAEAREGDDERGSVGDGDEAGEHASELRRDS